MSINHSSSVHGVSPSVGGDVYSPIVSVEHGGVPDHKSCSSVRVAAHQAIRLVRPHFGSLLSLLVRDMVNMCGMGFVNKDVC